jgi:hypothetical protein
MKDSLNTYYKCTLSATAHELNVSRHMLIWTFFIVLLCGTCARSLSASFSYTLCMFLSCVFSAFPEVLRASEPNSDSL